MADHSSHPLGAGCSRRRAARSTVSDVPGGLEFDGTETSTVGSGRQGSADVQRRHGTTYDADVVAAANRVFGGGDVQLQTRPSRCRPVGRAAWAEPVPTNFD